MDASRRAVDFLLRAKRDHAAARAFVECAIDLHGVPEKITIDTSGANTAAITSIQADSGLRIEVLGLGCMRCRGVVSMVGCPGPGSGESSRATFHSIGCFTRTRASASRHDSRQEPYAVVPHVRICAGGGE